MIRFHGVLAGHAALRAEVVPALDSHSVAAGAAAPAQLALFGDMDEMTTPSRKPWAWLLKHVFAADLAVCPVCAGAMKWLEVATTPDAIARLLAHHGLRARGPPASRKRRAPLGQLELHLGG